MKKTSSPNGQHVAEIGGKRYVFHLKHSTASLAERLLGTGILAFTGGGITYNLIMGSVMLEGQHGISTQEDVATLLDSEDDAASKVDEAIFDAVIDFFRKHYPKMVKDIQKVVEKRERQKEKANQETGE